MQIYVDNHFIMKRFTFLLPAFFGTFVYVLLSLAGGPNGFWAEKQLEEQKRVLSIHTVEIQKITDELSLEYIALQKDPDVIAAYAKKLGFVGEGEKLVKITGLQVSSSPLYNTGSVIKHQRIYYLSERVCKASGLVVFCLISIILILVHYEHHLNLNDKNDYNAIKGIPVYDLPQV